ncbi:Cytochrome bd-I ubiquinol oxidase subunit 2 [Pseudodesulfovibrio hydrargyri]|uniref:Cytochrome bd-I ubiquinol oxidase subunit 2 n=1 Tax=Pseudodesulfovibrio hydrargyri TaxID=2125990 RepID=A0A1J5MRA6_9BACT|nr:cytochrome d ubiquinol oxidase subunit II [Pseudodesulfovibrio hydrargyri]OIQ49126.1 Cytochrome bd-I ubiquinol oxidase subunit 2 [Pseudodesulfovibrio hydrargyri]
MTPHDGWFLLLGGVLFLHLGLGSIDLGVCLLSLFAPRDRAETMLGSIDSVWHANQTWLVVLGAMLFGAFPDVYGEVLTRLYGLVILLLVALALRALGLEYRHHAAKPGPWRRLAGWGAVAVMLAEGLLLGALFLGPPEGPGLYGLMAVARPEFFPALLFLFCCGLLMGGAWRLGWLRRTRGTDIDLHLYAALTLVGGLGAVLTGGLLCGQLAEGAMLVPWPFLIPVCIVGLADLAVLYASLRPGWQGSPLPWGLALIGLALAACAAVARGAWAATGPAGDGGELWFLTVATAVLLPPLLAFQIFQYRLERPGRMSGHPAQADPAGEERP